MYGWMHGGWLVDKGERGGYVYRNDERMEN